MLRQLLRRSILPVILFYTGPLPFAYAEPAAATRTAQTSYAAVEQGDALESSRQWLEAIGHYEESLKQWPESRKLKRGLRRSKIHFRIQRRYTDRSFRNSLLPLSRREGFRMFDAIYNRVKNEYVTKVSTTSLIAHGTENLYFALANDRYVDATIPGVSRERIRRVQRVLSRNGAEPGGFWNKPLRDRTAAHRTIRQVCDLCERELGLAAGPVVMEYVFGICNALDDYSSVLTPDRLDELYGNINGSFVGLGIEMKAERGKGLLLVNVLPDSPADEGGLRAGEHIVAIDGTDCRRMTTDEAALMLKGPQGSRVTLDIDGRPGTKTRTRTFRRRPVRIKSIPIVRMVDQQNKIGYIQMIAFQHGTTAELDEALYRLDRQGMRGLIWDLRGNPGGLLDTAAEVVDRFVDSGILVSTRGGENTSYPARDAGTWRIPLVVLIDGNSASASEIVAGAIRDHHRGTLIGRKTYGKWSVQLVLKVFPQQQRTPGLRLTTSKFYSPNGQNYSKVGVFPDIPVPKPSTDRRYFRSPTDLNVEGDEDLQVALRSLRKQFARR